VGFVFVRLFFVVVLVWGVGVLGWCFCVWCLVGVRVRADSGRVVLGFEIGVFCGLWVSGWVCA
jgi:hypothetical protein